ncbi:DUF2391 family protein [Sediminitomix flava]|uniref:Putative integral membrane protein DUF2391 n=1 Tax=Sediminitomix flava TaxID=379075 RepID=A0A315ZG73_SEDFL|nr:DUF2391 family protein [Sediminitomix flava]PWJ43858.1 putative integral membrane protein DUF2391 [Sediminitomix flava]
MANEEIHKVEKKIKRIDGELYETLIINDDEGNVVQSFDIPLKVELRIQDLLEIMVGASILAVPIAFTEEVWNLGQELSWTRVFLLDVIAVLFMASFVYFKAYRKHLKMYRLEFWKRVFVTFVVSAFIVGILLTIINKCPIMTDFDLAFKRILIGVFPAGMSATVTDNLS